MAEEQGKPIEGKLILGIGTGSGDIASFIGSNNTVVSVDISDCRQNKNNYNFSLCDESLPFKPESFDIAISNHVIEHVTNQELHIKEIKRVLYLATPNKLWPFEVQYSLYLLHYLQPLLFIKALKALGLYKEDVTLVTLNDMRTLLGEHALTSYSEKVIRNPK